MGPGIENSRSIKRRISVFIGVLILGNCLFCGTALAEEKFVGAQENTVQGMANPIDPQEEVGGGEDFFDENFDEDFDDYIDDAGDAQFVADPFYSVNYAVFQFNDFLYFYALKPVAQGYKAVMPAIARNGINNFFFNLLFPARFINTLLQGKLERASDEFGVFLVNSTAGVFGLNQVAQKHLGMNTSQEDLGQTLASYSVGDGFFIVLPVLGPSTLRDGIGRLGDYWINPVRYVSPWELSWGLTITDQINRTSFRIGDYEALKEASIDPYSALKNAYIQNRRSKIME